jgi:hypothetical protein
MKINRVWFSEGSTTEYLLRCALLISAPPRRSAAHDGDATTMTDDPFVPVLFAVRGGWRLLFGWLCAEDGYALFVPVKSLPRQSARVVI